MEGEINNLSVVCLATITSLCYCYIIPSRIPKGKYRLISLLPVFALFTVLPLYLTSCFLKALVTFFITWLANFKLLLFAFEQGQLSWGPPKSLLLFITITALPIKIDQSQPNYKEPISKHKSLILNLAEEFLAFSILMGLLFDYKEKFHPVILLLLYCCLIFLMVDILVSVSGTLVKAMVGLEMEPPSNKPYLSTSLQDFWGKRWNLMVSTVLRHTVYKPVRFSLATLLGDAWSIVLAILATFLVSGLMHELLFYYVTLIRPSWETTLFFVLNGACVVVEMLAKRILADKLQLPRAFSSLLTIGFLAVTSFWLFFPPLLRSGADVKVIQEFQYFVMLVTERLK